MEIEIRNPTWRERVKFQQSEEPLNPSELKGAEKKLYNRILKDGMATAVLPETPISIHVAQLEITRLLPIMRRVGLNIYAVINPEGNTITFGLISEKDK